MLSYVLCLQSLHLLWYLHFLVLTVFWHTPPCPPPCFCSSSHGHWQIILWNFFICETSLIANLKVYHYLTIMLSSSIHKDYLIKWSFYWEKPCFIMLTCVIWRSHSTNYWFLCFFSLNISNYIFNLTSKIFQHW